MRKLNNILARLIIILFIIHAVLGALLLLGASETNIKALAYVLLGLVLVHSIMSVISTIVSIRSTKQSGRLYFRQNAGFWTKRISGAAILVLLVFHINAYTTTVNGLFFLQEFTFAKMLAQFLLVAAVFVHVSLGIKSMLIARGSLKFKEKSSTWLLVISTFTLLFAVAIVVYYIRWQF